MDEVRAVIFPEDLAPWERAIQTAIRDRSELKIEYRVTEADGGIYWIEIRGHVITAPDDPQITIVGVCQNITKRKEAEEHRRMASRKLAHRVKNSLATAQAVFKHSLRGAPDLDDARDKAMGRTQAMSAAQDLLTRESRDGADLRDVVEEALNPFRSFDIRIDAPEIPLQEKFISAFILALYELATNSLKYGALSADAGSVTIRWQIQSDDADRFLFEWVEQGGPPVSEPKRRGFGRSVIEGLTPTDLGGTAILSFELTGVRYALDAPLPA